MRGIKIGKAAFLLVIAIALSIACEARAFEMKSYMVTMRDGARLATDVFFPDNKKVKRPVVLIRTPYGKAKWAQIMAQAFVGQKLVWVVQDTRGRFGSEGVSSSFMDDSWDGYDTVEWIYRQPWCDGNIGTGGVSAMGITQYVMDKTMPPHLTCQHVMAAAPSLYHTVAYQGGAPKRALIMSWLLGNDFPLQVLQMMLSNVDYGGIWEMLDLTHEYDKVNIPIMHMAGWYDMFLKGNLDAFVGLQEGGAEGARGNQRLVIGPWTHMGFLGVAGTKQGEIDYPGNSQYSIFKIPRWFQECLRGRDEGFMDGPVVRYYVMGDTEDPEAPGNEWRKSDVWPVASDVTPFYMSADGTLGEKKPGSGSKTIVDDPANPVPTICGANLDLKAGPCDQRELEKRGDVLVFSTPVLEKPVEITGNIIAKIFFKTDVVDTDFAVRLTDVYPDGRSMLITDGTARASHRESDRYRVELTPGETYELNVDLWATSIIINKGHRIRVSVAGSNFPRFDVNMHNGRYFDINPGELEDAAKTGKQRKAYIHNPDLADDARVANSTVLLGGDTASHILLPIVAD